MRRRVVVSGVLVGALVVSGGAVAGLSAATAGQIAEGVHAGPIQLGGLTPTEARARLEREYLAPLQTPIVVHRLGKRFELSGNEAKVTADLDGAVAQAVEASDKGNAFTSAWRTVTGTHVDEDVDITSSASRPAVLRFVDRVRRGVDRAPKESSLTFVDDRPVVGKSKNGMSVNRKKLARMVETALEDPARQPMTAPVVTTKPKVSEAQIRKQHPKVLTVDRNTFTLRLFRNFKLEKKYSVAVGMQGLDTPAGTYTINDKQVDPSWHVPLSDWAGDLAGTVVPPGPTNPIKARWMGFFDGAGIHGTSDDASIGSSASHGCVRMHVSDVIDLYERVPVGTTINVV